MRCGPADRQAGIGQDEGGARRARSSQPRPRRWRATLLEPHSGCSPRSNAYRGAQASTSSESRASPFIAALYTRSGCLITASEAFKERRKRVWGVAWSEAQPAVRRAAASRRGGRPSDQAQPALLPFYPACIPPATRAKRPQLSPDRCAMRRRCMPLQCETAAAPTERRTSRTARAGAGACTALLGNRRCDLHPLRSCCRHLGWHCGCRSAAAERQHAVLRAAGGNSGMHACPARSNCIASAPLQTRGCSHKRTGRRKCPSRRQRRHSAAGARPTSRWSHIQHGIPHHVGLARAVEATDAPLHRGAAPAEQRLPRLARAACRHA